MSGKYILGKDLAQQLLEEFEAKLRNNTDNIKDFNISNSITGKAQIVHKVMFEKATSQMFMFLRGFRKEIFDDQNVIKAFCKSYKNHEKSNPSEPFVSIVIKEKRENFEKNFKDSKFINEINTKFDFNSVFKISLLEPTSKITLRYKPEIEIEPEQETNILTVKKFNKQISIGEILSFQIFNDTFARVRQDVSKSSESKAVLHRDSENSMVKKVKNIFDKLVESSEEYSF